MQRSLQDAMDARRDEASARWVGMHATRQRNEAIERARHEDQEQQLRMYQRSFEPETPDAIYLQAAAFRGDRPISELKEEAREAEGKQKAAEFGRWWDRATPGEHQVLRGMTVGLIKENMRPEEYRRIAEAAQRDDDSIYDFDQDTRERAARVYRGSSPPGTIPAIPIDHGPGQSFREKLGSVGRGVRNLAEGAVDITSGISQGGGRPLVDLIQGPVEIGRELLQGDLRGARREAGESVAGFREPFEAAIEIGREAVQRDLDGLMDELDEARREVPTVQELDRAWRGLNQAFLGEQQVVTPFTRPLIHETLTRFGVPENVASEISKYAAEVVVPSTFATGGAGLLGKGKTAAAIIKTTLAEGTLNVLQNRAGHEARGEPSPSLAEDISMFAGGVGGRAGAELVGSVGGKVLRSGLAKRLATEETGALRISETVTGDRHRLVTDAGDRLDWRETPDGGHIEDVTVQVERQGTGTALLNRAIDDIRAKNPAATVTADLNSEGGARLFARQAGAAFTDRAGAPIDVEDAIESAGLREGPRVSMPAKVADEALPEMPEPGIAAAGRAAAPESAPGAPEGIAPAAPSEAAIPPAPATTRVKPRGAVALTTKPDKAIGRALNYDRVKGGWWVSRKSAKSGKVRRVFYPSGKIVGLAEPDTGAPTRAAAAAGGEQPPGRPPEGPEPRPDLPEPEPEYPVHRVRASKMRGNVIEKLQHSVKVSKRLRPEQQALAHDTLLKQTAQAREQVGRAAASPIREPGDIVAAGRGAMKGKRNMPIIEPLRPHFTPDEIMGLEDALVTHYGPKVHNAVNATEALHVLLDGYPLAPHQLKLLQPVLPVSLQDKLSGLHLGGEALELVNLTRVTMTSGDDSALLRQLGLALFAWPDKWAKNAPKTIRMLFSDKYTRQVATAIHEGEYYDTLVDLGARLQGIEEYSARGGAGVSAIPGGLPEEMLTTSARTHIGRLLSRVPGIRNSQRAMTVGIAALRNDAALGEYKALRAAGASDDIIRKQLSLVNAITGSGDLPPALAKNFGVALNTLMFAPRWLWSRVQIPYTVVRNLPLVPGRSPPAFRLAARTLLVAAGAQYGLLAAASMAGVLDVELDPRSADFGKGKIGPTRIDVTMGYGPIIRLAARVSTEVAGGKGLKTSLGDYKDLAIEDTLLGFLDQKISPPLAIARDMLRGETMTGEKLNWSADVIKREVLNRALPLFGQSVIEAIQEGGWPHAPLGLGEFLGLGVQSYTPGSIRIASLLGDDIQKGDINPNDYPELDDGVPRTRSDLHPADRRAFDARYKDELAKLGERFGPSDEPGAVAMQAATEFETEAEKDVRALADQVESGEITRAEFADKVKVITTSRRNQWGVVSSILEAQGLNPRENPNLPGSFVQDIYDYGQIFDRHPDADINDDDKDAMIDELDAFHERLGPTRDARLQENTNVGLREIPLFREFQEAKNLLDDSGYFDRRDAAWEDVQEFARGRGETLPDDPEDFKRQIIDAFVQERGVDPNTAADYANRNPYIRRWERMSTRGLRDLLMDNPEAIFAAVRWGYKDMSETEARVLRRMGYDLSESYIPPSGGDYTDADLLDIAGGGGGARPASPASAGPASPAGGRR